MQLSPTRPLGLAHFSCIEATPAELVRLAGWIGYASVATLSRALRRTGGSAAALDELDAASARLEGDR